MNDGTLLAPASVEGRSSDISWDAFVDISYDGGNTWIKSAMVPIKHSLCKAEQKVRYNIPVPDSSFKGKGVIQPTLWESKPGIVHMFLRSTEGYIYCSDSMDSGKTWSPAYATDLPNNNSGIDLTRLKNGTLALVYNPVGENWGPRTPLVIKLSKDNGITWQDEFVLEDQPGEYSYPVIVCKGNDIFITYTWRRERIVFWKITIVF